MGRQPSAWYVGMRAAAAAHADVRGFLSSTGADDCETRVAALLTSAHPVPLSLTIHLLILPAKWSQQSMNLGELVLLGLV